ncbi:uncharacterized protein LAESUDRAFT_195340 [Laetiporus sulphureus 93-53]|uniref:Uncharacterized protein n=1 Tax=Laetiporus sulphureus 93-53 TaxID=1314785 RepID=A0A165E169_9APHY|nr:uncharacterized protein LAESUDRAFT_195340 [Laetiporus sulphureus 93-53]KZT06049.1 hypothetical protein LAESUDRAFT_195340 [Laetiporus sulphureus 93-53]
MAAPVGANAALPMNNPQPRLPPEICERIIDQFYPHRSWRVDRQTVLNCALVCRGWYAQSRMVFYKETFLHSRKEAVACMRSLMRIPLLAGPELASIIVMLAGKLPNLETLYFERVSFEHCSMRHLAFWSLHEFSHITILVLHTVTLPSASPFFQVVCSFPHLQELYCWDLHWSKSRSIAPLPAHHRMPLTKVTRLGYDMSCFEGIGHTLLGLLDQAILKELTLHLCVYAATLASTQDILSIVSRRLEKAQVAFWTGKKESADANLHWQSLLFLKQT